MNGEKRLGWFIAQTQDDLNLHILRMFEGTVFAWRDPTYVFGHLCDFSLEVGTYTKL